MKREEKQLKILLPAVPPKEGLPPREWFTVSLDHSRVVKRVSTQVGSRGMRELEFRDEEEKDDMMSEPDRTVTSTVRTSPSRSTPLSEKARTAQIKIAKSERYVYTGSVSCLLPIVIFSLKMQNNKLKINNISPFAM